MHQLNEDRCQCAQSEKWRRFLTAGTALLCQKTAGLQQEVTIEYHAGNDATINDDPNVPARPEMYC